MGVTQSNLTKTAKNVANSMGVKVTRQVNESIQAGSKTVIKKMEKLVTKGIKAAEKPAVKTAKEGSKIE
jgi:hypothetical protein